MYQAQLSTIDGQAVVTAESLKTAEIGGDSFKRVVYNYRMAHVNEAPEPVASLVASHKLNCAECIDKTHVSLWVENRANADNLGPQVTNCVSQ